jgi:hypothetical protein
MSIKVINEEEDLQEVMQVLLAHLEPAKVMKFWAACKIGEGDYLQVKENLFSGETVDSSYDKIQEYQKLTGKSSTVIHKK